MTLDPTPGRFDPVALHGALNRARQEHGMSWQELGRAIGVSPSTISGMTTRAVIEADGVLAMTRWLGRSVESFVAGAENPPPGPAPTDWLTTERLLRVDTPALGAALDAERQRRDLTWKAVAAEISDTEPVKPATLARLRKGGRIDVLTLLAVTAWLDRPVAELTRLTES